MAASLYPSPAFFRIVLLLAFVATSAPGLAGTAPVGWWKFDEGTGTTTADASGNGANGALVSSATWTTGRVGRDAITFNGTTQSVAVSGAGSLANLYSTGLTVMAWINPTATGGRIVDKDNNSVGWFFGLGASLSLGFGSDQFSGAEPSRASASSVITLNTWQHVAATWDGSLSGVNIHLYINGVEATGSTVDGSGSAGDDSMTPFTIGNRPIDNAKGFHGGIDEVRVYNRVLSVTEIQALADSTAPSVPGSLTATAASSGQINLSWTASTDNVGVTGYLVERCTGAGCTSFAQIATPTGTTYSDTGRTASTTYLYRVRATDANSNLGGYSNTSTATTSAAGGGDTQPPTAPTGLAVVAASSSEVDLIWSGSTDNVGVTGYLLERCQGVSCAGFAQIATPTASPYYDPGRAPSTAYSYRIRATDAAGNLSAYSGVLSTTTPAASPDCN